MMVFCINAFAPRSAAERVILFPFCFAVSTESLVKASLKTSTNGPFPERNTECSDSSFFSLSFAIFKPARVFPAPGTPVRKQIDFSFLVFAASIILLIIAAVRERLIALESLREISSTL